MSAVTSDTWARALIAAAAVYGDSPLAALEARPGDRLRRCIAPAALALAHELRISVWRAGRILGVSEATVRSARLRGGPRFASAYCAALAAVQRASRAHEASGAARRIAGRP